MRRAQWKGQTAFQAAGGGGCRLLCMWFYGTLNVFLNLPCLIFFSIHKNDNNYTCHLCTSKERGRTNEMSVKGFELSRIKLLWLHKVQSSILHLYFSWHLRPSLQFFAQASATVAPNTPCPAAIAAAILEVSWSVGLLLFSPKPFSFRSWYLKRSFLSPVSCAC